MGNENESLPPEQFDELRDFQPPPQPRRINRRKGTLRVARVLNAMYELGLHQATTWDVISRLKHIGLWEDLWPNVSDEGAAKLTGDLMGEHGLRLHSIPGKRGSPRKYLLPPSGITSDYCKLNGIELVDDPDDTPPAAQPDEPLAGTGTNV